MQSEAVTSTYEKPKESGGFFGFFKSLIQSKTAPEKVTTETVFIDPRILDEIPDLEKKCKSFGLEYELYAYEILVTGNVEKLEELDRFLEERDLQDYYITEEEKIEKEIVLSDFLKTMTDHIAQKAAYFNINYTFTEDGKLILLGPSDPVMELLGYLVELEAISRNRLTGINGIPNGSESLNDYLGEIKKKVDVLGIRTGGNAGEESSLVQALNEHLAELKSQIRRLETKVEASTDEVAQEGVKFQKLVSDNIGKIAKKIDVVNEKVEDTKEQFVEKESKMKAILTSLDTIAQKVVNLEEKVDSKKTYGVDLDTIYGKVKNFVDAKLHQKSPDKTDGWGQKLSKQSSLLSKQSSLSKEEEEKYSQKQIALSTFHRTARKDIENKSLELGLMCDFGYDIVLTTGEAKNIDKFIVYLRELEFKTMRGLCPKYWNFSDTRKFALIPIAPSSEEFREVNNLFNTGAFPYRRIVKLERIQNSYLMELYITHVQKRKEMRNDNNLQRKLMFYGTKNRNPDVIYKRSDVGFDLQFSENRGYGKGLYFSTSAGLGIYAHNAFMTPTGTYQLLIADVLIGKPKYCNGCNVNYVKAPEGYDSVTENGNTFAIYNNFHSYPLYLMEYS